MKTVGRICASGLGRGSGQGQGQGQGATKSEIYHIQRANNISIQKLFKVWRTNTFRSWCYKKCQFPYGSHLAFTILPEMSEIDFSFS